MSRLFPSALVILASLGGWSGPCDAAPAPEFNRDVRPILSENCFACHGFDAKKREADLRLDTAEGAFADLGGYAALVPGDPGRSEAWKRILSNDPDEVMPPPKSHKTLTNAQKDTLKRWIEAGAAYQRHWSLEPPRRAEVPGRDPSPIDGFLEARLHREGLAFLPEADRATLVRRVSFTLTGLPPTLAEVEAFVNDPSPGAYEAMVDRYLASPRFGEEMARHWLDLARYGDTHGLHLDNERSMWAYRDWVVSAFNRNLPFDRFTTWQLAGDLLPEATAEQRLATGFLRCNVTTSEGGAIDEEYRHLYAVDRTATLTTAWLGLTGACAQCHDHKYDPLGTRDFYSLYAFFYSAADPPMDGNILATAPFLKLPGPGQEEALAAATREESSALAALGALPLPPYAEPDPDEPARPRRQVLFDDGFPLGAEQRNTSRNPPVWLDRPEHGTASGRRALWQRNGQFFEHRITPTLVPVTVPEKGGRFEVSVRPDPLSPPAVISVMVNDRRILWGDPASLEVYNAGSPKEVVLSGPLPEPGKWTRLSFDPADLGLAPGSAVTTFAVQQSGGVVIWDHFVLSGETAPARDPLASFHLWWSRSGGKKPVDLPGELAAAYAAGPEKTPDPDLRAALLEFYRRRVATPATDPSPPSGRPGRRPAPPVPPPRRPSLSHWSSATCPNRSRPTWRNGASTTSAASGSIRPFRRSSAPMGLPRRSDASTGSTSRAGSSPESTPSPPGSR